MSDKELPENKPLAGIYPALLTGFSDAGAFDEQRQRNIMEHVLAQDINGLYVGGSSAEAALMDVAELMEQQSVVAHCAQGHNKHLIAHVGQPSLVHSVSLAKSAEALGYDAVSALPPYGVPHTSSELIDYYQRLSEKTALPLIVYEVPARTGNVTPIDTLEHILNLPNVTGIKFTSADLYALSRLRQRCPDTTIFYGSDEMFGPACAFGSDGGIGTTYNVLGSLYQALQKAADVGGDLTKARELQLISQNYVEVLLRVGVLPGTKATLRLLGVDCGATRAPLDLRGEEAMALLEEAVSVTGFREWVGV
ncbi:MAG: dihydrodipicolinate synthase family protein [Granulosicoccus sp.]